MSNKTPRGERLVIALVGRRNAGKSSLINALVGQETAIVSNEPGTTTDPVAKHYELLPFGPVTFFDTAGLDDAGELGRLRIKATRKVLFKADAALIVVGQDGLSPEEKKVIREVKDLGIPFIAALNKADLGPAAPEDLEYCRSRSIPCLPVSALDRTNVDELKTRLIDLIPSELKQEPVLAGDLISPGDLVICVVPIDLAAPKGRLILPQVQTLREILDCDAAGMVVKERELEDVLARPGCAPSLVITDSQAILKVAGDTPDHIRLTTFSVLFARYKGDLQALARGADGLDRLKDGDKVLIAEACSHHPVADDIGRVKIPRWIRRYTGKELEFEVFAGSDFPEDLEKYKLAVHCGGCMINRMEMLRRIRECERRGVAISNYGLVISKTQGVLERVVEPFGLLN